MALHAPVAAPHRFSVDDYYLMAEVGILRPDGRFELIDGQVIEMAPEGPAHSGAIDVLNRVFSAAAHDRYIVRIQHPLRLGSMDEPEPDIALVDWRADTYRTAHPTPADARLVVEVAGSSLAHDRGKKPALYAGAGVPECWIVDVNGATIEVHRRPDAGTYRETRIARRGERVAPLAFPDVVVAVSDVVG